MPREFYLWKAGDFTVRVSLDLVERLDRALKDPRQRRGAELGGVLFGRALSPYITEIDNFEFFPSEHHRGTIYAMGVRERHRLAGRVAALDAHSATQPMGFFRTHIRPGLFLDQDDYALMTDAFADQSQIALLIRPTESGPATAGIFFWEEGEIDRRQTSLPFPFDADALRARGPIEAVQPKPARPLIPPISAAASKRVLIWSGAAVAGLLVAALAAQYRPAAPPRTKSDQPLNLKVRAKDQSVTVAWDKAATALKGADSAVLTVNDGGTEQKINLNRDDLKRGNVEYWPRTGEVSVKMDVGGSSSAPQVAAHKPSPLQDLARTQPKPAAVRRAAKSSPKPKPVLLAAMPVPAAPAPKPAAVLELAPAPPELAPAPLPVPRRSVAVSVVVEPRHSSEFRKVVSHLPLFGRSFHGEAPDFSPPRPSRPLQPQIPQLLAANLSNEVSVDVKVSIDKHGSVKSAEILNGSQSDLASLAADSAESATWEPARQGDRSVSSDVIVHYRFSPKN